MNKYREMMARQMDEINALPMRYAFGDKQFKEMMTKFGLDAEKDRDKITSMGYGGYCLKKDEESILNTFARHEAEIKAAVAADETGEGFICDMWQTELENHEYSYTQDCTDAMDVLGYTTDDVMGNPALKRGLELAVQKIQNESYD